MTARKQDQLFEAVRALAHTSRLLEKECEQAGLTMGHYRLLDWIRHEPARAGELAEKAAISRPSLTTAMDGLEARGLIHRDRVPGDRRGVSLEVTDDGIKALDAVESAFAARVGDYLSNGELKTFVDGVRGLREGIRRARTK
ncbi:MAG TPA: MarR family transcriptional regulator [Acidimicrobiales bacterium]|nr:MarR family transcriptional regulator [Acidimicrobiales bacterium]